ncbi:hypothetical protein MIND_01045500 [Mycena indigotica]|uniref:Kinetochore protein Spc24 n=1 Tax=Mycena indigotica TaxID=2126181 RepID=A0A8H6S9X7_9AGAR|nr:uncharacterized protein MIND_01045500 [Mycena indigotica]KAF7295072.1 hypothetical protein MIND_01045500 [Mycena indigotica]
MSSATTISFGEAIKAVRAVGEIMNPDDDFYTLAAAEETIAATETKRKKELEELHANLKALSKIRDSARQSATRPNTVLSVENHNSTLSALDDNRLSLGKSIKETERLVASKEDELATLKEKVIQLEDQDPVAEHQRELDSAALRLMIYKQLGFEPVVDKQGRVTKMLVRSQSGDIHDVSFNTGKTDMEYTAALWKQMCL